MGEVTTGPAGGRKSVLIVDDDVSVGQLAARLLGHMGYEVTFIDKPQVALERLRASPQEFDVLVTDHRMPMMTGLMLVRAIREAGIQIPVLMVSGYGEELTPENLEAVGVGPVLDKPYSREDLATRLQSLLSSGTPPKSAD